MEEVSLYSAREAAEQAKPASRAAGMDIFCDQRPRVLVMWPHPRAERIWRCIRDRRRYEEADAFTWLEQNGFGFAALDSTPYPLNPLARHGSALAGIDPLRFLRLLVNYRRFDAVVAMDSSAGLLFSLAKRVLRLRKPLVIIDPALTDTYRLRRRIHDLALPAANAVVVFGAVQQDYLEKCYGGRVHAHLVRHRIDARFFSPDPAAPEPERPYVLSVGDDVGRDFDTLITAAQGLDIQVIIKSSRSVRTALPSNVRVIPDRVTFEELRSLYQGARLVVLPLHRTLHASGVNTVLESMAMQKAVVVSDSEGLRDYVEHGRTAWVVPSGEPEPLRVAMLKLWHDGALRSALGRNARQFCLARCSMPVYMRTVAAIIGNCLKK